jgi:hypothetical protein
MCGDCVLAPRTTPSCRRWLSRALASIERSACALAPQHAVGLVRDLWCLYGHQGVMPAPAPLPAGLLTSLAELAAAPSAAPAVVSVAQTSVADPWDSERLCQLTLLLARQTSGSGAPGSRAEGVALAAASQSVQLPAGLMAKLQARLGASTRDTLSCRMVSGIRTASQTPSGEARACRLHPQSAAKWRLNNTLEVCPFSYVNNPTR